MDSSRKNRYKPPFSPDPFVSRPQGLVGEADAAQAPEIVPGVADKPKASLRGPLASEQVPPGPTLSHWDPRNAPLD